MLGLALYAFHAQAYGASTATVTLHPTSYVTLSGTTGDQPASVLSVLDQSGTQNDWNTYVEFQPAAGASPSYQGYRTYALPPTIAPDSVQSLQLQANYLGATAARQRWTWHIYDWSTGAWVALGDNSAAADWSWTLLTFGASGTLAHYIGAQGQIRIEVAAGNAGDNADLDYEALQVSYAPSFSSALTPTPTSPATASATATAPPSATSPPVNSATASSTPTPSGTAARMPGSTATRTSTATATGTATSTQVNSATAARTATASATATGTPPPPSATPTAAVVAGGLPAPAPCQGCWIPAPVTSWQWQLTGSLDSSVNAAMYDIDLFGNAASAVSALHQRGSKVACYLDAGTWENFRPDANSFPAGVLGSGNGWPGERWLDVRQISTVGPIMNSRLDLCKAKGFDSVEFDNVDGYANATGFPLSSMDQLRYNAWLANAAHARGLSAALKNDLDQVPQLLPYFDWALDEQCFQYGECGALAPFVQAGKAVMVVEYNTAPALFCQQANGLNFNALYKNLTLDASRTACR